MFRTDVMVKWFEKRHPAFIFVIITVIIFTFIAGFKYREQQSLISESKENEIFESEQDVDNSEQRNKIRVNEEHFLEIGTDLYLTQIDETIYILEEAYPNSNKYIKREQITLGVIADSITNIRKGFWCGLDFESNGNKLVLMKVSQNCAGQSIAAILDFSSDTVKIIDLSIYNIARGQTTVFLEYPKIKFENNKVIIQQAREIEIELLDYFTQEELHNLFFSQDPDMQYNNSDIIKRRLQQHFTNNTLECMKAFGGVGCAVLEQIDMYEYTPESGLKINR